MRQIATIPGLSAAPMFRRFNSYDGEHLLIVPYSRVFDLSPEAAKIFDQGGIDRDALVGTLSEPSDGEISLNAVVAPEPQCISLNVSSNCNLSCTYCYAARGSFDGAQPDPMRWETARAAIDALLARADATAPITVGFLGGEPFVNRELLHASVHYACERGKQRNLDVRFSVTTNGTLLCAEDIALLRQHRFAVTISIDGGAALQDRQRPTAGAKAGGSFARLARAVGPLLAEPGLAQIAARATVTRHDFDLSRRFADILDLGFPEVGFAPLRMDKGGGDALLESDWPAYCAALKRVAASELERARNGAPIRLTNIAVALKQIGRGASSPYPCGAGGGYFSVASDGRWYACHRAIGTPDFELGDSSGLDAERRRNFLERRHVHAQEACRTCWARYLCSGACHQEATARTESACGFIRDWLEFCLGAYCELERQRSHEKSSEIPEALVQ